jgi:uncharacterized protein (TIGR03435 family)
MRTLFLATILIFSCFGQPKLEFEVASIKPAPLQPIGRVSVRTSSNTDAGTMTYLNVSLLDLIGQAFKVQQYQISGPQWMNDVRFDINARFTPGSTPEQLQQMQRSLIADRFGMKMHQETKEVPVYALVVGKGGSKLKPTDAPGSSSSNGQNGVIRYEAKVTMARFGEYLSQRTNRPVLDKTGLQGAYEIKMEYTSDENNTSVPSLLTAIQEELGLKLEATKGPVVSIVVDSAEKTPSEN